jgi:hypothetical protein
MLENPIAPEGGFIRVPEESGFGMRIKPEVWNHPAAVRRVSAARLGAVGYDRGERHSG